MTTKNEIATNTKSKDADARESRFERAIRLLQTTAVDPFQLRLREFKAFYPAVVAARHNGMKNKQILKLLADGGLKLYPGLLEKLMSALEKAEGAPACQHCGQTLRTEASGTNARKSSGNVDDHASEPSAGLVEEALASHA